MAKDKDRKPGGGISSLLQGLNISDLANPAAVAASLDKASESQPGGVMLRVDRIERDPNQPRKEFDEASLDELAGSMREVKQLQPINVRPNPDKPGWFIINWGERRWLAAQRNSWPEIRAEVGVHDDVFLAQIVENLERAALGPIEIALAINRLIESGMTAAQVAKRLGKSPAWVSNYRQVSSMPEFLQSALRSGIVADVFTAAEAFRLFRTHGDAVESLVTAGTAKEPIDRKAIRQFASDVATSASASVNPVGVSPELDARGGTTPDAKLSPSNAQTPPAIVEPVPGGSAPSTTEESDKASKAKSVTGSPAVGPVKPPAVRLTINVADKDHPEKTGRIVHDLSTQSPRSHTFVKWDGANSVEEVAWQFLVVTATTYHG